MKFILIIILIVLSQINITVFADESLVDKVFNKALETKKKEFKLNLIFGTKEKEISSLDKHKIQKKIDNTTKKTLIEADGYILQNLAKIIEDKNQIKFDSVILFFSNHFLHDSRLSPTVILFGFYKDSVIAFYVSKKDSPKYFSFQKSRFDISPIFHYNNLINTIYISSSESENIDCFYYVNPTKQISSIFVDLSQINFYGNNIISDYNAIINIFRKLITYLRCN